MEGASLASYKQELTVEDAIPHQDIMPPLEESDSNNSEVAANRKTDCSKTADSNIIYHELQEFTNLQRKKKVS